MLKRYFVFFIVKLGYSGLSPLKKANKANHIVDKMTGNGNYPSPVPALADVTKAADDVEAAQGAMDGSKIKTKERDNKVAILDATMEQLQGYVITTAKGDEEKILSSGFEISNPRTKTTKAGPLTGLTIQPTINEGEVNLKWKPLAKSGIKKISVSYDLITWQLKGETSKSKITLTGLTSGSMVHVRVACVNTAGSGPWSDIASCKVL